MSKFMMIYVNDSSYSKVPIGIITILSILEKQGHEVMIFDTSKYGISLECNEHKLRSEMLNFQDVDLTPFGVTYGESATEQMRLDLKSAIEAFKPDVIGVSITEETSHAGFHYADLCKQFSSNTPIIMGGVFCMTRPDVVMNQKSVDMVCVAEGEHAVQVLMDKVSKNEKLLEIPNVWIKGSDGNIIKNSVCEPIDLNDLPYLNISLLDDNHLYSPFAGHVYKMSYVESQRGCPRKCTYCCNQIFLNLYSEHRTRYLRKKTIPRFIDELVWLKETYELNFFQFLDDDFLFRPIEDIREFSKLYKERVCLPFWIQAEAWNCTDEKIRLIREAGCISISIGIETGNDHILKNVMKRKTPREKTIEAFKIMHKYDIRTSANVIIGMPDESRETIFDTIELVRECEPKSLNSNIFVPYFGTELREYSVENNYLPADYHRHLSEAQHAILDLPDISKAEVESLARVFALYATLDKAKWADIELVEKDSEGNSELRERLEKEFWDIMIDRGINIDIPGFDYDLFLKKRQEELAKRENSSLCVE